MEGTNMYYDETYEDIPYAPITTKGTEGNVFTGNWRTMRPVLDTEKCINCNICWKFCPDVAIATGEKHVTINYDYCKGGFDMEHCKGCGICASECPDKVTAIIMEEEAE